MIRKLLQYKFTVIMTAMLLTTFAAYMFRSKPILSETENRYLAGRPKVTLSGLADGSFMDSFELYVKEQLPLRDTLIKLKALTEQAQFKNENNGIVRGRDGYLFEKLVSVNPQLYKNEAAIINFAKKTDREINVCIVPNSFEILTDKVPDGFPDVSEEKLISELYDKLGSEENVHTVSVFDVLRVHKDEYIYYKTDHHWTTLGAYYGYEQLCSHMGLKSLDIKELADLRKDVDGFYGTYYSKYKGAGTDPDILSYYDISVKGFRAGDEEYDSLYDIKKLDTYDKYAMFMHGNEGLSIVDCSETEAGKRNELIIFKDSYSNCLIPFLTYDYDRITVVDLRYYSEPVSGLLNEHDNADILLIYNFMHYNEDNHFYRLTS